MPPWGGVHIERIPKGRPRNAVKTISGQTRERLRIPLEGNGESGQGTKSLFGLQWVISLRVFKCENVSALLESDKCRSHLPVGSNPL